MSPSIYRWNVVWLDSCDRRRRTLHSATDLTPQPFHVPICVAHAVEACLTERGSFHGLAAVVKG
jgi:hypothetical protein